MIQAKFIVFYMLNKFSVDYEDSSPLLVHILCNFNPVHIFTKPFPKTISHTYSQILQLLLRAHRGTDLNHATFKAVSGLQKYFL
jgi:hypothetical protein